MRGIVFGRDRQTADKELKFIIDKYQFINIKYDRYIVNSSATECYLSNGDHWLAVGSTDCLRGMACNIAYIDRGINIDTINYIILPMVKSYPYTAVHYYGEPNPQDAHHFAKLRKEE